MNSLLLGRSIGAIGPQALQRVETNAFLHSIQSAPGIRFDGSDDSTSSKRRERGPGEDEDGTSRVWAHRSGVNCIVIDKFEGRYMLSGGADASIKLWDLEAAENTSKQYTHHPAGAVSKFPSAHQFGITHLSFYPFDSLAFLSTSYDHTLKIYSSTTLTPSATFSLSSVIYSHALSPIATHLLVACSTQSPAIRLVDLRSGASTHSLAGHAGAVLSVAWSPRGEYVLASGGSDGTARLWDIRRSAGSLGVLDLEDSVGIIGEDGYGRNARPRERGKAHIGACNGVVWTDDGDYLVTAGHDERVRVWDMATGANALSHFGPIIKNAHLSTMLPMLVPTHVTQKGLRVMIYPNEKEILMFDLFEGTLLKRLRAPAVAVAQSGTGTGQRNIRNRVTSLAGRSGDVEFYSAHSDGVVRGWLPRSKEEAEIDEDEKEGEGSEDEARLKKRKALDDVFRNLTRQKITFT